MRFLLALAVAAFAFTAAAQNSQTVRAHPKGALMARIVVTDREAQITRLASKPDKTPLIKNKPTFSYRNTLSAATLISGLEPDKDKKYYASVSYRVYDPEGQVVLEEENHAIVSGRQVSAKAFVTAQPNLTIKLDREAKKGPYTIEAQVTDKISKRKTYSREKITLE